MIDRLAEDPFHAALSALHPPMPEGKEHLVYRDFPKLPERAWDWILEVLHDYELHVLTEAKYRRDGGDLARGQIWVHPDGLLELERRFALEGEALFNPPQ